MVETVVYDGGVVLAAPYAGHHAHDAVHRRADVVAHVGEKYALGLVGRFGLLLGEGQLLLIVEQRGDVLLLVFIEDIEDKDDADGDGQAEEEGQIEKLVVRKDIGEGLAFPLHSIIDFSSSSYRCQKSSKSRRV